MPVVNGPQFGVEFDQKPNKMLLHGATQSTRVSESGGIGTSTMSKQDTNNLFPDGVSQDDPAIRAAAIRAAADGELTPEQIDALRGDASFERRLGFERGLRDATGRVMADIRAPGGLRDRVLSIASQASNTEQDDLADRLAGRADQTRDRSFWSGQRRLMGALAAVLVLTVAGVFVARLAGLSQQSEMLAYRTSLARFVSGEHTRTLDEEVARAKYIYTTVDSAVEELGDELDHTPAVLPCGGKNMFRGAGPCGVPGQGPSCHFQYIVTTEDGLSDTISIFVKQDHNELEIEEGTAYLINTRDCDLEGVHICVWRRGGLLYSLVVDEAHASLCGGLLTELGVRLPDPNHPL